MFYFFLFISIIFTAVALSLVNNINKFELFAISLLLAVFSFGVAVGTLIEK
jgi:hypothetical protein